MFGAHARGRSKPAPPIQYGIRIRLPKVQSPDLRASVPFPRAIAEFAFDVLSDSMHLPIRQLDGLGGGAVLYTILSKTRPHGDRLADIIVEIFSLSSASFQSGKRNSFKRPRCHGAAGILYIQVKIPVGVLPFKTRKRAREIHAFIRIELGRERVMSGRGNCRGKETKNRHQNTGESSLHVYLLDQ